MWSSGPSLTEEDVRVVVAFAAASASEESPAPTPAPHQVRHETRACATHPSRKCCFAFSASTNVPSAYCANRCVELPDESAECQ